MPDREKVINGLEHCIGDNCNGDNWGECEYSRHGCIDALLEDTLALLKAQEPVEPKKNDVEFAGLKTWDWACPECNCILTYRANYCSCCGKPVKWE